MNQPKEATEKNKEDGQFTKQKTKKNWRKLQYERRKPEKVWCKKPKEQTNVNITTNQFVALAEEEPYQKEEEVESAQNNK